VFSLEQLHAIRAAEIETIAVFLRQGARILEIGAGTGQQALALSRRGFSVEATEIPDSTYKDSRVFPVVDYDGSHIPFADGSMDIVFSSNVLEHVPDLHQINAEIRRVLKLDGYCIHIMPTHSWRFWTTATAFPDAFLYASTLKSQMLPNGFPTTTALRQTAMAWWGAAKHLSRPFRQRRHGERGNLLTETWLFHPSWWRRAFKTDGFEVVRDLPMGLFYTGNMVLGTHLSIAQRTKLCRYLGSACHLFEVRPTISSNRNAI
jgi:SAM-dependent methyltransferase